MFNVKRPLDFVSFLVLLACSFVTVGCQSNCSPQNAQNAYNSLEWHGDKTAALWVFTLEDIQEQPDNANHFAALARSHQDLRDDAADVDVPNCAEDAKSSLLSYLDAVTKTHTLMARGANMQEVEASIEQVERLHLRYQEEMQLLRQHFQEP